MLLPFLRTIPLLTVIGAFVTPGTSHLSLSSTTQSRNSDNNHRGQLGLPMKTFKNPVIDEKTPRSFKCHAADPSNTDTSDLVVVGIAPGDHDHDVDIELADEKRKEGNLSMSYIVLGVLLTTFASNQWSRQAIYYLCDFSSNSDPFKHINAALSFDKEQYASLASFGFTIIFASVSLIAGSVSDRFDRNVVTAVSCGIWSAATALQGFAKGYGDLIPLRAVIGASQAFFNPAAYTIISEIFPKKMIGSINGIFSSGIYLGGGLASLSIILDGQIGWRNTLFVIGGLGVLVAAMCSFLVTEPRAAIRSTTTSTSSSSTVLGTTITDTTEIITNPSITKKDDLKSATDFIKGAITSLQEVLQSSEARLLFSASVLRFCAGFSIAIWKAPFVFAKFPDNAASFAGSNAVIVAIGGLLSSLIGGFISDYLASPPPRADGSPSRPRARAWVAAVGSFLAAPLWAAFILAEDPAVAAACLLGEYLTAECWFGPTLASLFDVVPKDRRGTAQGFFSVLTAAGNIAPVAVGAFAGGQLGSFALGDVLIFAVSGTYILSGILFGLAAFADEKKIAATWKENKAI